MDAMIYAADVYCVACGTAHRERITAAGEAPANPDDESSYDSDEFPKGPYSDGGGEADTPQHCADCHVALENDLTEAGVRYVLDYLNHYDADDNGDVLDGWARQLDAYALSGKDARTLADYRAVRKGGIPDLTPEEIEMGREWIGDCQWADLDPEDVEDLTAEEVRRALARHFAGGVEGFVQACFHG